MRKLLCGLVLSGVALSAHAVPIPFEFDGGSIEATGAFALDFYQPSSGSAVLDNGESENFIFGTVGVLGVGSGQLTVTVNFIDPTALGVGVSGPYSVAALLFYNAGEWSGGSSQFDYTYNGYSGTGLLTLDPINESCSPFSDDGCLPIYDFVGSITNLGSVQVPEPASLGLLGLGLLGMGVAVRRRRHA